MASQKTINKCKQLCKQYQVNYRFGTSPGCYAFSEDNFIYVDKTMDNKAFISGVFHEIQHCLNYRNKKYAAYHNKIKTIKVLKRWALPAEIYTDIKAKKLAKKHGFKKYIRYYYNTPSVKKVLSEFINKEMNK